MAFAPAKGDRAEWVVQKLTEIGVDDIVVVRAARSVVRWEGGREGAALGRLRRVAAEAMNQSRRVWLPDVRGPVALHALASDAAASITRAPGAMALAEPGGAPFGASTTGIAVGPEGGWSEEELALGWPTVSLGDGVLRSETAAVVAAVLLSAQRAGTVGREERPR